MESHPDCDDKCLIISTTICYDQRARDRERLMEREKKSVMKRENEKGCDREK